MKSGEGYGMIQLHYPAHAEVFTYPGGEIQVRLRPEYITRIQECDGVSVAARITSANDIVGLALFCEAIEGVNIAASITLLLPYLPYARADRRFLEGDCLGIRTFGQLLASIAPMEIRSLDVHSKVAELEIPALVDVSPAPLIDKAIAAWGGMNRAVHVLYPDKGALDRYCAGEFAGGKNWHATKKRDPVSGKLSGFEVPNPAEFGGQPVIIVDDICDGGGTFIGIADELGLPREQLALYVTHGIFSKGYAELYRRFGRVYCSDSFGVLPPRLSDSEWLVQYNCWEVLTPFTPQCDELRSNSAI